MTDTEERHHRASPQIGAAVEGSALAELLPHAGRMCLLDAVVRWDADAIVCRAHSHLDPQNPLRYRGRLDALCAVEYAGQAVALHGALRVCAPGPPRLGYLARLGDVELGAATLDSVLAPLIVTATRLAESTGGSSYDFSVAAGGRWLTRGRLLVAFPG